MSSPHKPLDHFYYQCLLGSTFPSPRALSVSHLHEQLVYPCISSMPCIFFCFSIMATSKESINGPSQQACLKELKYPNFISHPCPPSNPPYSPINSQPPFPQIQSTSTPRDKQWHHKRKERALREKKKPPRRATSSSGSRR